jgi:tetratricopeptide (TPR) repeat protein
VTADLQHLRDTWLAVCDGEAGHEYGSALESAGRVDDAREIHEELIEAGYLIGYWDLAWLEHAAGNTERARDLLCGYLEGDDEPDEDTALISGVLGHWIWDETHDPDAEALLEVGATVYPSARADLAHLYRATKREDLAEALLREGVAGNELESFIVLGNLLDETGRAADAEAMYVRGFEAGDGYCAYNLSLLLRREGRDTEAHAWLLRGVESGDEKAKAYYEEFISAAE